MADITLVKLIGLHQVVLLHILPRILDKRSSGIHNSKHRGLAAAQLLWLHLPLQQNCQSGLKSKPRLPIFRKLYIDDNFRFGAIDHLPIRKKRLRRARPIPTALVTVGNPGNPLHFSEKNKPHCVLSSRCANLNILLFISPSKSYLVLFHNVKCFP